MIDFSENSLKRCHLNMLLQWLMLLTNSNPKPVLGIKRLTAAPCSSQKIPPISHLIRFPFDVPSMLNFKIQPV